MVVPGSTPATLSHDLHRPCKSGKFGENKDESGVPQGRDCLIYIQGPPIQKFGDGTGIWAGTTEERSRGRAQTQGATRAHPR
jgi:hypothetical protein